MKPNILVCGYTGSGKTRLLQAFCGSDMVPDSAIGHGKPETMGFSSYEALDVRFWDSKGMELGETEQKYIDYIQAFVRSRQASDNVADHIHLLWYCISGDRARVTQTDQDLIKNLFPVTLVVVTKNDIVRKDQREAIAQVLHEAGVQPENSVFSSGEQKTGLNRVLLRTMQMMPDAYSKAIESLMRIRAPEFKAGMDTAANRIAYWAAGRAAAIAVIPLPFADMPLLVGNETYMIVRIGSVYGVTVTKNMIATFLGTLGASIAGMVLADFLPIFKIPIAAGITYGVGMAAKAWFENDMSLVSEQLKEIYEKNKEAARNIDWKDEAKQSSDEEVQ